MPTLALATVVVHTVLCSLFAVAVAWLVVIGWVAGFGVVFGRALPVGFDGDECNPCCECLSRCR